MTNGVSETSTIHQRNINSTAVPFISAVPKPGRLIWLARLWELRPFFYEHFNIKAHSAQPSWEGRKLPMGTMNVYII